MDPSAAPERRAPVTPSSASRYHRRRSSGTRDDRYRSGGRSLSWVCAHTLVHSRQIYLTACDTDSGKNFSFNAPSLFLLWPVCLLLNNRFFVLKSVGKNAVFLTVVHAVTLKKYKTLCHDNANLIFRLFQCKYVWGCQHHRTVVVKAHSRCDLKICTF